MFDRTGNRLIVAILIGMILGVIVVAIFGENAIRVKFLGDIFLNALRMVVIPLLFCSMVVGISKLGDVRKLGRTGLKTVLYFLVTSSIAVIIGLILVNVVQPGSGFGITGAEMPETVHSRESYSFFSWLVDQIPSNIIGAAAETQVLPIIVFALFFGGVLTTIGAKGKPVIAIFEGINEAIMKIVHIIMWFAPIGIFGLVAGQLASQGGMSEFTRVLSGLGKYALVVIVGLLVHAVIILPLILKFIAGKNPLEYFIGMSQALMTAGATASSSATLPVTLECAEENNDIDKRSTSFVLPLGATINMDGTALYEAVAAMFIAQAWGIDLSVIQQITIFATAVLASIGAAGIPEAGLVTMVLVLQAVGLPLEGIGLILAIDWFLDRCRTAVNVWGDSIGAAVIATTAEIGLVDRQKLKQTKARPERRFKGLSRRKDARSRKKGQEMTRGGSSRERIPHQGKRTNEMSRSSSRRHSKSFRKPGRSDDKRDLKKEMMANHPQTKLREEYKPQVEEPKEKAAKTPETKTARNVPGGKWPVDRQDRKKSGFGRKRQRHPHAPKTTDADETRAAIPDDAASEKTSDQNLKDKQETGYDVPKFPETILDDLVANTEESSENNESGILEAVKNHDEDESKALKPGIAAEAESSEDSGVDSDGEKESEKTTEFSMADDSPTESNTDEDFSKLDQAFEGISGKSGNGSSGASDNGEDRDDSGFSGGELALVKPEFGLPSKIDSDASKEISETSGDGEDQPDLDKTTSDSPAGSDTKKSGADGYVETAEDQEPESGESATADESDEGESDDDSMQWGRRKQKKLKR